MENFREVQSIEKNHMAILAPALTAFRSVADGLHSRSDKAGEVSECEGGRKSRAGDRKGRKTYIERDMRAL